MSRLRFLQPRASDGWRQVGTRFRAGASGLCSLVADFDPAFMTAPVPEFKHDNVGLPFETQRSKSSRETFQGARLVNSRLVRAMRRQQRLFRPTTKESPSYRETGWWWGRKENDQRMLAVAFLVAIAEWEEETGESATRPS